MDNLPNPKPEFIKKFIGVELQIPADLTEDEQGEFIENLLKAISSNNSFVQLFIRPGLTSSRYFEFRISEIITGEYEYLETPANPY